jgi:SAM-dependent methyltransferase
MSNDPVAQLNDILGKIFNEQIAIRDNVLHKILVEQIAIRHDLLTIKKELEDVKAATAPPSITSRCVFEVISEHLVAVDSWDHKQPRGAAEDNTRSAVFVAAVEDLFTAPSLTHLDLGCAGGGLVYDFLLQGHCSIGIEGSDYLKRAKRGHWSIIPNHLFTADITKPFKVVRRSDMRAATFQVITAMEVMEHIPESCLNQLLENIYRHLSDTGLFCCSIATFPDFDETSGAIWHVTVQNKDWWIGKFESQGFVVEAHTGLDFKTFPRGTNNPLAGFGADNDFITNPQMGFHLVLKKRS